MLDHTIRWTSTGSDGAHDARPAGQKVGPVDHHARQLAVLFLPILGLFAAPVPAAPDPGKVVRMAFDAAETGFDPVRVSDGNSSTVIEAIFERLLTYDYLARPAKLVPMVTEAMPEVSADGRTYTFRIRQGIHFSRGSRLQGATRASWWRRTSCTRSCASSTRPIARPTRSCSRAASRDSTRWPPTPERPAASTTTRNFPTSRPSTATRCASRLAQPDLNFAYVVAHTSFGAVAREVIDAYPGAIEAHPVGTGAYQLAEWKRASRIVLVANPAYRGFTWDFAGNAGDKWDEALIAAMRGKHMPQVGRVEISVVTEFQSQWLAFRQKQLDVLNLPSAFRTEAFEPGGALKPALVNELVSVYTFVDPEIIYAYFNFRDPVVGGFAREKVALRRAMILGYKVDEDINVIRRGMAVRGGNAGAAGRGRTRPGLSFAQSAQSRARQPAAGSLRLPQGTGWLSPHARRQAAGRPLRGQRDCRRSRAQRALAANRWTPSASGWSSMSRHSPTT